MATRKKRTTPKRTNKKVKQTKAEKPSMTDQLREARKRYTVSKSSADVLWQSDTGHGEERIRDR